MPEQPTSASTSDSKEHFARHAYYDDLMGGARRKPALPIGGPAVARHLAFWCPNDPMLNRDVWIREIEKYILALYHHLSGEKLDPRTRSLKKDERRLYLLDNSYSVDDKEGEFPAPLRQIAKGATRYQTFRVRFYYGGMPASVGVELHDEYFTLSSIIDLAWPTEQSSKEQPDCLTIDDRKNGDWKSIQVLQGAIVAFNRIATEHHEHAKANRSEANKPDSRRDFEKHYEVIYEEVWNKFSDRLLAGPYQAAVGGEGSKLGGVFVDFRGFVTTVAAASDGGAPPFIGYPGSYSPKKSLVERIGTNHFEDSDAVYRADTLLPWLKADKGFTHEDKEADRTEPVEFTCTRFLDKRALFATALGAQLSRKTSEPGPMTYIVLGANQARWQMGRLIDRVHVLGTLRLAALYGLPHLIVADAAMRVLESEIEQFMGASRSAGELGKIDNKDGKIDNDARDLGDKVRKWRSDLSESERQISGGVARRVERFGYYQGQFEQHLEGFRSERIEGFPPYKEAVNRRLAGDYELFRTVGEHHRRLREVLAGLDRRLLTTRSLALTNAINQATAVIEGLQTAAEFGFWAVLFPYYVSRVFTEAANLADSRALFPAIGEVVDLDWLSVFGSIIFGLTLAIYTLLRHKIKSARLAIFVLAIMLLGATCATYFVARIPLHHRIDESETFDYYRLPLSGAVVEVTLGVAENGPKVRHEN